MSGDDAPKKVNRPGTFDSKRAKEAGARRGKPKGIYSLARKHQRWVVEELRRQAEHSPSETARNRALIELARLCGGVPPSARELGALPPEPAKQAATPADLSGILASLAGNSSLLASLQALNEPVASYTAPPPRVQEQAPPAPEQLEEAAPSSEPAEGENAHPDASQEQPGPSAEWAEKLPGCSSMLELTWKRILS